MSTSNESSGWEKFLGLLLVVHGLFSGIATWALVSDWSSGLGRLAVTLIALIPVVGTIIGSWGVVDLMGPGETAEYLILLWVTAIGAVLVTSIADAGGLTEFIERRRKRRHAKRNEASRRATADVPDTVVGPGTLEVASDRIVRSHIEQELDRDPSAAPRDVARRVEGLLRGSGLIPHPGTDLVETVRSTIRSTIGPSPTSPAVGPDALADAAPATPAGPAAGPTVPPERVQPSEPVAAPDPGPEGDGSTAGPTSTYDVEALTATVAAELRGASLAEIVEEVAGLLDDLGQQPEIRARIAAAAGIAVRASRATSPAPAPRPTGRRAEGRQPPRAAPQRTARTTPPDVTSLDMTPRCYRVGRSRVLRLPIDDEMLERSDTVIPSAFSRHLNVEVLATGRFELAGGLELVIDRRAEVDRLTGVRPLLDELGLTVGDHLLLIAPDRAGRRLQARGLQQRDLARLRPAQRAALLMGSADQPGPGAAPVALGLPRSATRSDVIERLVARGETDLARMLEQDIDPMAAGAGVEPSADMSPPVPARAPRARRTEQPAAAPVRRAPDSDATNGSAPDISDIADILGL